MVLTIDSWVLHVATGYVYSMLCNKLLCTGDDGWALVGRLLVGSKNWQQKQGWLQSKDVVDLRVSLLIHYMTCTTTPLFAFSCWVGIIYQVVTETGMTYNLIKLQTWSLVIWNSITSYNNNNNMKLKKKRKKGKF